jgi:hypothetical protein
MFSMSRIPGQGVLRLLATLGAVQFSLSCSHGAYCNSAKKRRTFTWITIIVIQNLLGGMDCIQPFRFSIIVKDLMDLKNRSVSQQPQPKQHKQ